jgi:CheY-like chemotaxis protein
MESYRILYVEDDDASRDVFNRLLAAHGHAVTTAATCAAALRAAETQAFDLLVADIGLPDGDGWDLFTQIRNRQPIPGIVLSAYAFPKDAEKTLAAGYARHISKPVNSGELIAAINEVMGLPASVVRRIIPGASITPEDGSVGA